MLVTGQVVATNSAHSVRGPKHVVKGGKITVLTAEQTRELLDDNIAITPLAAAHAPTRRTIASAAGVLAISVRHVTGRQQHLAHNWLIDVLVQSPLRGATAMTYGLRNRAFVLSPHRP
jgi:hypothetical protein